MKSVPDGRRLAAKRVGFVFLAAVALVGLMAGSGRAAPGDTTRVSVSSSGSEGNSDSGGSQPYPPSISEDGRYVAFESDASNLVDDDTNGERDVFMRDRQTGTTERVSADNSGGEQPSISADGRYVAFRSSGQVVVRDRQTETTKLVSVNYYDGTEARFGGLQPSISADGRYVAFTSWSDDLVENDSYHCCDDVFVRDLREGTTERVSVNSSGDPGNHHSFEPAISADGRYVAFVSTAWNLVENYNTSYDVFVRDRQEGTTELVNVNSSGIQGDDWSFEPSISADGRYVAFRSWATNLGANDANEPDYYPHDDVFVRDLQEGTTERVNVSNSGSEGNDPSVGASISGDGRYVAFGSSSNNLVASDTNGAQDIFVRDRQEETTERVSLGGSGNQGNNGSFEPSISADGRHVAFESGATNLVEDDTNGFTDVFVHERNVAPPPPITDPVKDFAPVVYLHRNEKNLPMSADDFIARSDLRWSHDAGCKDHRVSRSVNRRLLGSGGYAHSTANLLCRHKSASYTTISKTRPYGGVTGREGFYLNLANTDRAGTGLTAPAYYDYQPENHFIAYWFFYPYNDQPGKAFDHEGDWEHIVVRLNDANDGIVSVDYYYHEDGISCDSSQVIREGSHPVVFSAKGGHGSYPIAGFSNGGGTYDQTEYSDLRWNTVAGLLDVADQPWYGFGGAWGEVGEHTHTTGPLGPSLHKPPTNPELPPSDCNT